MNTNLNTQTEEHEIKQLKRWKKAYETIQEMFPELPRQSQITFAICLVKAVFSDKH